MNNIVNLQHICHSYGNKKVLHDITFDIKLGEFVCLLGPSGCGKTTTLRILSGLENPSHGYVEINNKRVCENGNIIVPPEKRGLGVVFQDFSLFPHLTVEKNVLFALSKNKNNQESVEQALKTVNMLAFKKCYPSELSGGQQQRVSLARAIASKQKIVLLDEPFSHLDSRLKEQIRDQTLHTLKSVGAAGLMITHDPEEAMFMADKIIVMSEGKILQIGSPQDIYMNPKNPFIAHFFGDINRLYGKVSNDCIYTPAGCVSSLGFSNGQNVEVLVRPEGIEIFLENKNCSGYAVIEEIRMLGALSLVHLNCFDSYGKKWHMHAKMSSINNLKVGDSVYIKLKKELTFVFSIKTNDIVNTHSINKGIENGNI